MPDPKRVYWDSCCWIGLICEENGKIAALKNVLDLAQAGHVEIVTSTLSAVEVFKKKPASDVDPKAIVQLYDRGVAEFMDLLNQPFVVLVTMDIKIAYLAGQINERGIIKKTQDIIHLATALRLNVDEMHTYDHVDLIKNSGKFQKLNNEPLVIRQPSIEDGLPMFEVAALQKKP